MSTGVVEIQIERERVARYFLWSFALRPLAVPLGLAWGAGLVLATVWLFWPGPELSKRRAQALRYWLEGTTLRVDGGLFALVRKAIPLDRVTDLVLVQGPLMRHCGIWSLQIQTAGSGHAEAVLWGVRDPEAIRTLLLAERDHAAAASR